MRGAGERGRPGFAPQVAADTTVASASHHPGIDRTRSDLNTNSLSARSQEGMWPSPNPENVYQRGKPRPERGGLARETAERGQKPMPPGP